MSVGSVAVQGWPWARRRSPAVEPASAGKNAPPSHWPSSPCKASSRAPHPSVATRARSAATTSAGASARSRSACHRMAGSASSSQSSTVTGRVYGVDRESAGRSFGPGRLGNRFQEESQRGKEIRWILGGSRHSPDGLGSPPFVTSSSSAVHLLRPGARRRPGAHHDHGSQREMPGSALATGAVA